MYIAETIWLGTRSVMRSCPIEDDSDRVDLSIENELSVDISASSLFPPLSIARSVSLNGKTFDQALYQVSRDDENTREPMRAAVRCCSEVGDQTSEECHALGLRRTARTSVRSGVVVDTVQVRSCD